MSPALLFIIGLLMLLLGSRGIISHGLALAAKTKISPLVIGFTFVAIGTVLPEMSVSLFSGLDKGTSLGVGNIIGSNIVNIALIFAVSILSGNIRIGTTKTQQNMYLYLLLSLLFLFIIRGNYFSVWTSILLLTGGVLVFLWEIKKGKKGAKNEDRENLEKMETTRLPLHLIILLFSTSLIFLIIGSKIVVDSGIEIAKSLGISPFLIGVTAVALGTSLPEMTVAVMGAVKKEDKLIVGNILGSNIYNLLFCGGIVSLFPVERIGNLSTPIFFIIITLAFALIIHLYKGLYVPRIIGTFLIFSYLVYLLMLLT